MLKNVWNSTAKEKTKKQVGKQSKNYSDGEENFSDPRCHKRIMRILLLNIFNHWTKKCIPTQIRTEESTSNLAPPTIFILLTRRSSLSNWNLRHIVSKSHCFPQEVFHQCWKRLNYLSILWAHMMAGILFAFVALIEKGQFLMTKRVFLPYKRNWKVWLHKLHQIFQTYFQNFFLLISKTLIFNPRIIWLFDPFWQWSLLSLICRIFFQYDTMLFIDGLILFSEFSTHSWN